MPKQTVLVVCNCTEKQKKYDVTFAFLCLSSSKRIAQAKVVRRNGANQLKRLLNFSPHVDQFKLLWKLIV